MADVKNRKIWMFRTHIDPAIGAGAQNAFSRNKHKLWSMELTPQGVFVTVRNLVPGNKLVVMEHLVPFSNIQSVQFANAEQEKQQEAMEKEIRETIEKNRLEQAEAS